MHVRVQYSPDGKKCPVCEQSLGLLRKLKKNQFCCEDHQEQYLAELREIAVGRLQTARLRLDSTHACQVSA